METYIIKVNGKTYEVEVSKKNEEAVVSGAAGTETDRGKRHRIQREITARHQRTLLLGDSAEAGMPVTAGTSGKIWKISAKKEIC